MGGDQMPHLNNSSPVVDPSLYGYGGQKRTMDEGGEPCRCAVTSHTGGKKQGLESQIQDHNTILALHTRSDVT